ncbi:unnamed protein product [Caenorhabditis bovis]|uniref:fatty acid amide hydrolase n=1 Tax=Caenorhabditis bovis TaxID=2654633 RepID=A0A8S1EX23_9PELO|nr:unnamed protein product [Caenorhabditis bovis]
MLIALLLLVALYYSSRLFIWYQNWKQRQIQLKEIIRKKREARKESIEFARKSAAKIDEQKREFIGGLDFIQLRAGLQNGSISCIEALRTYYYKAIKAHEKTNALCMFVTDAEKWAIEWDEKAKNPAFVKPPFFGIPFSLKENCPLKGYDQTRGFVQDCFHPTKKDGVMVNIIKMNGGVPFCQTNIPQSLLSFNCCNPVYGTTNFVMDKERTCGGSSGGEAALISADGSLIGIGGDVGGSIRIPCAFCGIVGFKPSHLRYSHRGVCGSVPGRPLINSNEGPMCKDVTTVVEYHKTIWGTTTISKIDPYVPPVLWNEQEFTSTRPLRIGYYIDDGWFTPTPACQRAVLEAKQILERNGHKLVPFTPPDVANVICHLLRAICVDSGRYLRNKLLNDVADPHCYFSMALWFIPVWVQRSVAFVIQWFYPRISQVLTSMTLSTPELRESYAFIEQYREDFTETFVEQNLDVILCPATVTPAMTHNAPGKLAVAALYTAIFNLLDYGAGVVPVTKVTEEDDKNLDNYPATDPWYREAKRDSKGLIGYPIAVQVAAPPYSEEACFRVLSEIEIGVKSNQ